MKRRIAAIDIGTNSVLLTVVERVSTHPSTGSGRAVEDLAQTDSMQPLYEAATITRIGEGLSGSNRFQPQAMERTLSILKEYAAKCTDLSVNEVFAVGTAAMRKAENSDEFIKMVFQQFLHIVDSTGCGARTDLSPEACLVDFLDLRVLEMSLRNMVGPFRRTVHFAGKIKAVESYLFKKCRPLFSLQRDAVGSGKTG